MRFSFAYVKYRDTNEYETLATDVLENFDSELHNPTKCYFVRCTTTKGKSADNSDSDGDEDMEVERRYKVQVLILAETREEIQETLNSETRVRIPKIYDSSISSQESDEGSPAVSKGQKRDVDGSRKKLKQKSLLTVGAKDKALQAIMKQRIQSRSTFAEPITPLPIMASSSKRPKKFASSSQAPTPITKTAPTLASKSAPIPGTKTAPTPAPKTVPTPALKTAPIPRSKAAPTPAPKSNQPLAEAYNVLERENQALKERNKVLEDLNVRLQREILDKFTTPARPIPLQEGRHQEDEQLDDGLDYTPIDGQFVFQKDILKCCYIVDNQGKPTAIHVSLGEGIFIQEEKYNLIMRSSKNSIFVKNLAVAMWGSETLRDSSVEGKACPRFKDRPAKQGLEPDKLAAVKRFFHHHLSKQPLTPDAKSKELTKFKQYIREKIMDLNRRRSN